MNRLLKMSAAALSTLLLATGANAVVNTNNACPAVQNDCDKVGNCSVTSSDCNSLNNVDLQGLIDQCNSNTDVLKALIENGNCNSDDLKCLISDGTCTVDEVCSALENCDTDCTDVKGMLEDVRCVSDGDCVSDTSNCGSDVDAIKSLLENVAAKSSDTDCTSNNGTNCNSKVNSSTDCGSTKGVKTVVEVVDGNCKKDDTVSRNEEIKNTESCTSDCDTASSECENSKCDENKPCENGDCNDENLKSILSKYGIDINDCIVNGNCGKYTISNGKYNITYGSYEDLNRILKALGFNSDNVQKPATENKTDTESKPTAPSKPDTDTVTSSEPTTENNSNGSVSEYEKRVVELVNIERARYGLSPLTLNSELSAVARLKSQDMKDKRYFSHTSPTYGSPFDMMKKFGITYRTAGENIARGQRTPEEVVNGWMNSEGHRANILNSSFKEIGVGYVSDGNYWTQMFIG